MFSFILLDSVNRVNSINATVSKNVVGITGTRSRVASVCASSVQCTSHSALGYCVENLGETCGWVLFKHQSNHATDMGASHRSSRNGIVGRITGVP